MHRKLLVAPVLLATCGPALSAAQTCSVPESVRLELPAEPPAAGPYATLLSSGVRPDEIQLGVGHLHLSDDGLSPDGPPGADDWFRRVELPLSLSPGEEPTAWIVGGWILRRGVPPEALSTIAMVETGYEEPSFVVLESRPDGWIQIRYSEAEGSAAAAWVPACALASDNPLRLTFTPWSEWLLSDRISPLFFRSLVVGELRSAPSATAATLVSVSGDHSLEPLEVRGEWMRVGLKQPSDYCHPEVVPVRREGWVRWYSPDIGPRVWYFTRGC
jgi:hypothetical protein